MGVGWDAPVDSMLMRLNAVPGIRLLSDTSSGQIRIITYANGEFAGNRVNNWTLLYLDGKLVGATLELAPVSTRDEALPQYRTIIRELTEKYGEPKRAFREPQLPGYQATWKDAEMMTAITQTKSPLFTEWMFSAANTVRSIYCAFTGSAVMITYGDLQRAAIAQPLVKEMKSGRKRTDDY